MKNINEYINSGILEMYVLGLTSAEENSEVEKLAAIHSEINKEIDAISKALMFYSETSSSSSAIDPTIKSMIMATIDYTERLKGGEKSTVPPMLNDNSKVSDFAEWLNRKDLVIPEEAEDIEIKIIGHQKNAMTAIVWIKDVTPYEVHDHEYEKFLIIEGTCDIITDSKIYSLVPGDYFAIPLHMGHTVKVTSKTPCKVILQRMAA
ncbi:MAG: cupin domain-containing protein [Bacteroidota bacterium]|nr:cupin domain-containing protein [Bacteroidota bacterium]